MLQKLHGVVLGTVRYSDKSNIVRIYTEQMGCRSFLVPVQRSRKSTVRQVLFRPLSIVEFEAEVRPHASIYPIKEARPQYLLQSLPYNPYKSAIALFLAEFLNSVLREEDVNEPLSAYLANSIRWLDASEENFANFHLVFLMRLSRFLGLYPNTEGYADGCVFDLLNASFVRVSPSHGRYLLADEAAQIRTLMRMNYETMHLFAMNRRQRGRCLEVICDYYRLHIPDFPELKSVSVLQELF